jgi:hypothetical protein
MYTNACGIVHTFEEFARDTTAVAGAHQLDIVDAFLSQLLKGSPGCCLKWESDSL